MWLSVQNSYCISLDVVGYIKLLIWFTFKFHQKENEHRMTFLIKNFKNQYIFNTFLHIFFKCVFKSSKKWHDHPEWKQCHWLCKITWLYKFHSITATCIRIHYIAIMKQVCLILEIMSNRVTVPSKTRLFGVSLLTAVLSDMFR